MRTALLTLFLAIFVGSALAQDGATYMRKRDNGGGWQGHHGGYGYGQPYYGGYYDPPAVYGSWYARPYPTHLDYFRLRGMPMPNCPCVDTIPSPPEVIPAE